MFERFTDRARRVIVLAQEEAGILNNNYISSGHILLGLIREGEGAAAFTLESLGISLDAAREQVQEMKGEGQQAPTGRIPFTPRAKKVLEQSLREALRFGHNYVGTEHILLGLVHEGEGAGAQVLVKLGVDPLVVRQRVIQLFAEETKQSPSAPRGSEVLDQFGRNLTQAAREGKLDPVIGREKEIERVMQVLSRRTKNNPVLIGEPGVGKTAVVEGLSQAIVKGEVPDTFRDKQLYRIDVGALVANCRHISEIEERLARVATEVDARLDLVLFVDEPRSLVASTVEGTIGTAAILRRLSRNERRPLIATASATQLAEILANDPGLEAVLQPVPVSPPTVESTVEILKGLRDRYEAHHGVSITDAALSAAATLADRDVSTRCLPDSAISLIDEAGARVRVGRFPAAPELRELDENIARTCREKENAIDEGDFEKAAALRETEKKLRAAKAERVICVIDQELVEEIAHEAATLRKQAETKRVSVVDLRASQLEEVWAKSSVNVWSLALAEIIYSISKD